MRTRRRFTQDYKETAVRWLDSRTVADVARLCDVSISVLHRWRRTLGDHAVTPAEGRRKFTRDLKAAAVERLESGASIAEVAAAFEVRPNTLHRWRKEAREFGRTAFAGYGKSRVAAQAARTIKITLQGDEYQKIHAAFENSAARSLPDFARSELLESEEDSGASVQAIEQIEDALDEMAGILKRILWIAEAKGAQSAGHSR